MCIIYSNWILIIINRLVGLKELKEYDFSHIFISLGDIPVLTAIFPNDNSKFCGLDFIQQDELHYGWYPGSLLENNNNCQAYGTDIVTRSSLNTDPILTYAKPICSGYGAKKVRHGVIGVNIDIVTWLNSYIYSIGSGYIFLSDNITRFYTNDGNLIKLFGLKMTQYVDYKYTDIQNEFKTIPQIISRGDKTATSI